MKIPLVPSKEVICSGECPFIKGNLSLNFSKPEEIVEFILTIARVAAYFAVPISVVVIVYVGVMTIFGAVTNPWAMILNILIGLGIAILAATFIALFTDILKSGINLNIF